MAPPPVALAIFFSTFVYMAISYLCHYNLFDPQHARGRVVLVTDATSKLGHKMATEFAKMNAKLILVGKNENELENLRVDCFKAGAEEVVGISGNFLSDKFRHDLIDKVGQHYGKLNYLILMLDGNMNASTSAWTDGTSLRSNLNDYFVSYAHIAGLALPLLKRNRGHIGVVSTMSGKVSLPYLASVSATKAALQSYLMSLRQELKFVSDGYVSVTSVTIAYMDGGSREKEQGRWGQLFAKYGTVDMENAVNHAVYAIGGRRAEVTFPFVAQCHSVMYRWFQSLYEDPEMPNLNRLLSTFSLINLST